MITRLMLIVIIIFLVLFTAGCCQLGSGVTSFLEEAGSPEDAEVVLFVHVVAFELLADVAFPAKTAARPVSLVILPATGRYDVHK